MAELDKSGTVTLEELILSSLATADALAKLLIEKGIISEAGEAYSGTSHLSSHVPEVTGSLMVRGYDTSELFRKDTFNQNWGQRTCPLA